MIRDIGIALKYILSRSWTHKPIILTHAVTARCNCRCKICDIWSKPVNNHEMSKSEIFRMLDEAKELNFTAYLVWGGEPLIRQDILEILQHAHDNKLYTIIITNGVFLAEKAEKLEKVVDLTLVSLDHHTEYHDEMRGRKGTFNRALKGIIKLREAGGRVAINCVLSKLNHDSAKNMLELAHKMGVKIAFDPMKVFPGCNEQISLSAGERAKVFSKIRELDKRGGFVLNSYDYLDHFTSHARYSCAQPSVFLVVSEDGKIKPFWCQKTDKLLGDLREQSLSEIVNSDALEQFAEIAKNCNLCINSTTVETSMYYSTRRFFTNYYKWNNPYLKFLANYAL